MAKDKKMLKKNIWKFYLFNIIGGFIFFIPIVVLFWQDNGLSLFQIMVLQSLFSIATVLLEVPTGYFADIYGRKKALFLSSIFITLAVFVYSLGHSFFQFLIAEMIWAVGLSLMSGTDTAFLYDTLKDLKKEKNYKKVYGQASFYAFIAVGVSSIIGGFVGNINLRWTFYITIPVFALLIPLTLSLKEPKRHKKIIQKGYFSEIFRILKKCVYDNKKLRWLMIYSAVILGFGMSSWPLYQPYLIKTGISISYIGIVYGSFTVIGALSSKYAHIIEKKVGEKNSLIIMMLMVSVGYLLMGYFVFIFSFVFIFFQQFVWGFSEPVISDYINKLTTSDIRATVLSAQNFVVRSFYACVIPLIGWFSDVYTITQALLLMGIVSLAAGIVIMFFYNINANRTL